MTSPAGMTDAECATLVRYIRGAEFSGAARRMLGEFMDERDWDELALGEAIVVARKRRADRSPIAKMCDSPVYCGICGKAGAGVTDEGWRCEEHFTVIGVEPTYDWGSGFPLNDATEHPATQAD